MFSFLVRKLNFPFFQTFFNLFLFKQQVVHKNLNFVFVFLFLRQLTGKPLISKFVPIGPDISVLQPSRHLFSNSARRLEVLRTCVTYIFENKIADARKIFPAVLRALQTKDARLALCSELSQHVFSTKAVLEPAQFDMVIRLMNRALTVCAFFLLFFKFKFWNELI